MTIVQLARLAKRWYQTEDPWERDGIRYALLASFGRWILPRYRLTDHSKVWFADDEFSTAYGRFCPNDLSADRKFFLRELLKLVGHLDGDTAEAGVLNGASSWFICEGRTGASTHWAFDSFSGLPEPGTLDGDYWRAGDLSAPEHHARELLEPYGARVLKGWIPDVYGEAQIKRLVFAHIDVDLYAPTLASLEFFYPLTVPGGVIVCDDYGFVTCPGARRALDEFMAAREESVIHCPTGQGLIIKR